MRQFNLKNIQNACEQEEILKTRQAIGAGLRLSLDNSNKIVRLHNDCDCSIYWICPGLFQLLNENLHRPKLVKSGESTIIFNYNLINLGKEREINKNSPLFEANNIVNVSFKKNWGELSSHRQSIEYCPCWLNISFNQFFFNDKKQ